MSKTAKIWLIAAISFLLIGCVIFGGVIMAINWDFSKLSTEKYETNNYEINETYSNISIITNTADIKFEAAPDGKSKVVCFEDKNEKHSVEVADGTLSIKIVSTKKWYEHIGFDFKSPKITVYLPEKEYGNLFVMGSTGKIQIPEKFVFKSIDIKMSTGMVENYASAVNDIKIKTSTGGISSQNVNAQSISINVSTGDVNLKNINCKNFISEGDTGSITLKNVIVTEKICIERSTGNIKFEESDAKDILAETDTGSVKGSLLSEKVFIVRSDTGKIDVPKTVNGGKCEITTDTGDIKIVIK